MRRVLGAWIVFAVLAGPRALDRFDRLATNLSEPPPPASKKQPVPARQDPGHDRRRATPRPADVSAGSERGGAKPAPRAPGAPPTFAANPLLFLSTAPVDSLDLLPGIGPVLADRIARARGATQRFTTWDQLLAVRGIGPKTIEKLQALTRETR